MRSGRHETGEGSGRFGPRLGSPGTDRLICASIGNSVLSPARSRLVEVELPSRTVIPRRTRNASLPIRRASLSLGGVIRNAPRTSARHGIDPVRGPAQVSRTGGWSRLWLGAGLAGRGGWLQTCVVEPDRGDR